MVFKDIRVLFYMSLSFFLTVCVLAEEANILEILDKINSLHSYTRKNGYQENNSDNIDETIVFDKSNSTEYEYIYKLQNGLVIARTFITSLKSKNLNLMTDFYHKNIEQTFLYIKTERNGLEEIYYIRPDYEITKLDIKETSLYEKYNYLLQYGHLIEHLHKVGIVHNNDFDFHRAKATYHDKRINQTLKTFVENSYEIAKKEFNLYKRNKYANFLRKFAITDVGINNQACEDSITDIESKRKAERRTYVSYGSNNSIDLYETKRKEKHCESYPIFDTFDDEYGAANKIKPIDCYLFGYVANELFEKAELCLYTNEPDAEDFEILENRNRLKDTNDPIDKLIYDCTDPDPNIRPKIQQIIKKLKEVMKKNKIVAPEEAEINNDNEN